MQQHQIALPLARTDVVERQRLAAFSEARQLVVMGRKQAAAAVDPVDRLDHRPGQSQPVIGRGAPPNLVKDHKAALARLRQNRGGFDHLDHEGGAPPSQIVRRPDPAEQPVGQTDHRATGRNEPTCLREQHNQRVLAQEGALAAHVGSADQPQPVIRRQTAIIGNKPLAFRRQRGFNHRVPPAFDLEHAIFGYQRPAPAALRCSLGLTCRYVEPGQSLGRVGNRQPRLDRFADQFLKMRLFGGQRMPARFGNPARLFVERQRVEPHGPGHGLAVSEATLGGHQAIGVTRRNFDKVSEHAVVADLERGDPGLVAVLRLQRGNRAAGIARCLTQSIEGMVIAPGNVAALPALGWRGRHQGAGKKIGQCAVPGQAGQQPIKQGWPLRLG